MAYTLRFEIACPDDARLIDVLQALQEAAIDAFFSPQDRETFSVLDLDDEDPLVYGPDDELETDDGTAYVWEVTDEDGNVLGVFEE